MSTVRVSLVEVARSVSPDMFADLVPGEVPCFTTSGDVFEVTFEACLDAAGIEAVRDRLLTDGPVREAARAEIRALRDAEDPALAVALANYVLGDALGDVAGS